MNNNENKPSVIDNISKVAKVAEVVTPVASAGVTSVVTGGFTWKRLMRILLLTLCGFWVIKYLAIFTWKILDFVVFGYIHDITDKKKLPEVLLWTLVGGILTISLYPHIISVWEWFEKMWNEYIIGVFVS